MFCTMTFIKDNLLNRLTTHLSPCAHIYSQHTYTLSNFPYAEAIMAWRAAAPTRGRYGSKNSGLMGRRGGAGRQGVETVRP